MTARSQRRAVPGGAPARQWNSLAAIKQIVIKFCLDGFSVERFFHKESHFQLGWAAVEIGGRLVRGCCSRLAFRPVAKALAKEEDAIPPVVKVIDEQLSSLEQVQLPDTSIRLKLPDTYGSRVPRWLKPIFSMDYKAWCLTLSCKGASGTYFCCYNCTCTSANRGRRVEKLKSTTTWGMLRRCGVIAETDYAAWKATAQAAGVQGSGENGNIIKADYYDACKGQKGMPLLTFFPDNTLLLTCVVIEPLHCCIQTVNHMITYFIILAHTWGGGVWPNRTLMRRGRDRVVDDEIIKGKVYLTPNHIFPARYSRPMMGYAGTKLWTMMRERDDWLPMLFVRRETFIVYVARERHEVTLEWRHPKLDAMKEQLGRHAELMRQIFELRPSDAEIAGFGDLALAAGRHLLEHFDDYILSPYQHWLYCHMWEFMEHHRGVGKLSSIVAEAANAMWKDIAVNHDASFAEKSVAAFVMVAAATNPNIPQDDEF